MDGTDVLEIFLGILLAALIVVVIFGLVSAWNEAGELDQLNAQSNRDCVQLGYAGGELAPDMPNALRCWTIILVDEQEQ